MLYHYITLTWLLSTSMDIHLLRDLLPVTLADDTLEGNISYLVITQNAFKVLCHICPFLRRPCSYFSSLGTYDHVTLPFSSFRLENNTQFGIDL